MTPACGSRCPRRISTGPTRVEIDRVEIYATTVARARSAREPRLPAVEVPRRDHPDQAAACRRGSAARERAARDTRPAAGEKTMFVEKLTPETLKPAFTAPAAVGGDGGPRRRRNRRLLPHLAERVSHRSRSHLFHPRHRVQRGWHRSRPLSPTYFQVLPPPSGSAGHFARGRCSRNDEPALTITRCASIRFEA